MRLLKNHLALLLAVMKALITGWRIDSKPRPTACMTGFYDTKPLPSQGERLDVCFINPSRIP